MRRGAVVRLSSGVLAGLRLSLAANEPVTWQARMRSSSMTGAWLASDSSKPFSTHAHDGRQIGPRVEQPHRGFQRIGVGALLDDARALAVILADDDQRAADHAGGGEVGQRVGGDVGADDRLPGHRAAQRIIDRGAEHGGGGGFVGAGLDMHAEFGELGPRPRPSRRAGARPARPDSRRHRTRPDCSSALVTARMPSPWKVSPSPSRSDCTSFLNERSIVTFRGPADGV